MKKIIWFFLLATVNFAFPIVHICVPALRNATTPVLDTVSVLLAIGCFAIAIHEIDLRRKNG